jgi:dTDP-4-dehydrorhamnose 3,5-epimerase
METYKESDFSANGIPDNFVQDNHSQSLVQGTLRGLHYQLIPAAQGKLVRCVVGAIYDVAVDIRKASPTYGNWVAAELSAENRRMVWIPPGFAHGFCTLTDTAEVVYKATARYSAAHDRIIRWNDPALTIDWPVAEPTMSPKDRDAPTLAKADNNFESTQPAS